MHNKRFFKAIIVYIILIPVMWLLSAAVSGAVFGYRAGQRLAKAYSETELSDEVCGFLKKHGISQSMSKEKAKLQLEKLSPKDKAEFRRILLKSVKLDDIKGFGFLFTVSAIVFGSIGFLSGILTKTWVPAGTFPLIAWLLQPIRRFVVLHGMPLTQTAIIVLFAQFAVCYLFAYLGSLSANRYSKNKSTIPNEA